MRRCRTLIFAAPASVLLLLDEESNEREGRAPKLEKAGFLASKIDPRTVRATQNRAWAARFERENAKAMRKIYKSRRRSQSNGQSGDPRAFVRRPKSAQAPRPPKAQSLQIDRDIYLASTYSFFDTHLDNLHTNKF